MSEVVLIERLGKILSYPHPEDHQPCLPDEEVSWRHYFVHNFGVWIVLWLAYHSFLCVAVFVNDSFRTPTSRRPPPDFKFVAQRANTFFSLTHAYITLLCSFYFILTTKKRFFEFLTTPMADTPRAQMLAEFSAAYFVADTIMNNTILRETGRKWNLHHFVSLIGPGLLYVWGRGGLGHVMNLFVAELGGVVYHIRKFFGSDFVFLLVYSFSRLFMMFPWFFYAIYSVWVYVPNELSDHASFMILFYKVVLTVASVVLIYVNSKFVKHHWSKYFAK